MQHNKIKMANAFTGTCILMLILSNLIGVVDKLGIMANPTMEPTSSTPPACAWSDPSKCGCREVKQADYRGHDSTTVSGSYCQRWDQQSPHAHSRTEWNYPNSGLVNNYCRNPDGEFWAWCYTTDPNMRWDFCDVPRCHSSETPQPACAWSDPNKCGCEEVDQADYRGHISMTADGLVCQRWDQQSPHAHTRTPQKYRNSGLSNNYCRNPDGESGAWCYTTDPNKRWDYCNVPTCHISKPTSPPTGTTSTFNGKKVPIVGIDGCMPAGLQTASTPIMDSLRSNGAYSFNAFAGGVLGTQTQQRTDSGPGWTSILTGIWRNKHGVVYNDSFPSYVSTKYPHFYKHIKDEYPNAYLSSIVQFPPIHTGILDASMTSIDYRLSLNPEDSGQAVAEAAVEHLQSKDPDVMFIIHFNSVDHAGHIDGFKSSIPQSEYVHAIEETDALLGNIMEAIENRANIANEDWLIIVTTDHGGREKSHGGDERDIFNIVSGGATPPGKEFNPGPGHVAVPPTVYGHLGISVDDKFGWEEAAFGLPP